MTRRVGPQARHSNDLDADELANASDGLIYTGSMWVREFDIRRGAEEISHGRYPCAKVPPMLESTRLPDFGCAWVPGEDTIAGLLRQRVGSTRD